MREEGHAPVNATVAAPNDSLQLNRSKLSAKVVTLMRKVLPELNNGPELENRAYDSTTVHLKRVDNGVDIFGMPIV